MAILGWMLFGLVSGVVAKLVMPGSDPDGMIVLSSWGSAAPLSVDFSAACLGCTEKPIRSSPGSWRCQRTLTLLCLHS